ncbi:MAG: oxidoreductase [Desulfobaccales bacterium]
MPKKKPKLAVWKFTSCDGCQLSLLYLEDELLELAECVEIAYFPEASRRRVPGPYDISLVEGSVSLPEHLEQVQRVRRLSKVLIAFGTCATSGGIQALRNFTAVEDYARLVYERPELIPVLAESTPISQHVPVDLELQGCPPNRAQVVAAVAACLHGAPPPRTPASVCLECKRAGHICVLVSRGLPCLGPVTQAGCGALCPGWHRPCYGCFGPKETPKTSSLARWFTERLGAKEAELVRAFRLFYANAPAFRLESEAHEEPPRPG